MEELDIGWECENESKIRCKLEWAVVTLMCMVSAFECNLWIQWNDIADIRLDFGLIPIKYEPSPMDLWILSRHPARLAEHLWWCNHVVWTNWRRAFVNFLESLLVEMVVSELKMPRHTMADQQNALLWIWLGSSPFEKKLEII